MSDLWLNDLEKAQDIADRLVKLLQQYTSPPAGSDAARVRGKLAQLTSYVNNLERSMMSMSSNPASYSITRYELTRRGELLAALSETRDDIDESMSSKVRAQVVAGNRWDAPQARQCPAERPETPSDMMADQILQEQDDALDFLQGTVENLKNIGQEVTHEVDLHSRLLDDVDERAEKNRAKYKSQMALMNKVFQENTSECCLWTIIVVLIVLNFLVLVLL